MLHQYVEFWFHQPDNEQGKQRFHVLFANETNTFGLSFIISMAQFSPVASHLLMIVFMFYSGGRTFLIRVMQFQSNGCVFDGSTVYSCVNCDVAYHAILLLPNFLPIKRVLLYIS